MTAFRVDERIGAGFQADGTFKFFITKFLEGCKEGGKCEDHDEKEMMYYLCFVFWMIVWVGMLLRLA